MGYTTCFELQSQTARLVEGCQPAAARTTGLSPSMVRHSLRLVRTAARRAFSYPLAITTVPCGTLQIWTGPASLAVTEGILVSFFSSTY